jgi:mRNA-degrading endonuclease HigB of HigAB toxin-antitoxin module
MQTAEELDYRAIDVPWFYASHHVFERAFQVKHHLERMRESFDTLRTFINRSEAESHAVEREEIKDSLLAIRDLMESVDVIQWNFPELASKHWFGATRGDIEHAYWRVEDGRFDKAYENEEQMYALAGEVQRILDNFTESIRHGFYDRLNEYIQKLDWNLISGYPPERYEDEIREAKDMFCLGYYSTSLIVLGRAVEKTLLELGQERKVRSVHAFGETKAWKDTKFYTKNEALSDIDMSGKAGKVISDRQYHEISILIKYRNDVAHAEYDNISRDEAIRKCSDAGDLLVDLEEEREYLEKLDDNEINPVENQTVN